jgi:hydrogenase maturation protein HypF
MRRWHIEIGGLVQGVGFRPHLRRLATRWELSGWAKNSGGSVEAQIQGPPYSCSAFLQELAADPPLPARLLQLEIQDIPLIDGEKEFEILASSPENRINGCVPVDIGICDKCREELLTEGDRRYGYPFTNCCHCGPRYTIIRDLPYDRERTTMEPFEMCDACRGEYEREDDRRFHAEPNACERCGPSYSFFQTDAGPLYGRAAVERSVKLLTEGKVVAVKGIGGYHLACLAKSQGAIERIRRAKSRPHKPMAVMTADLEAAAVLGEIGPVETRLLLGPDRPIVLLKARPSGLAPNVAPGLNTVGVMLPYAPIHCLLLQELGEPLVLTSANDNGAPIVISDEQAAHLLDGPADGRLSHNREIVNGCDDSIVRRAGRRTITLRAGRGKSPQSLPLAGSYPPILACGADLKSSVCIAVDGWAHISQYLGDLANADGYDNYGRTAARLGSLLGVEPRIAVCDSHPDYLSTAYAAETGLPVKRVLHHHAHVVAAMVEAGIDEPVIGVAFDGTGWGEDGRIWGGEWLVCDRRHVRRAAHLKEIAMPGGEAVATRPWRLAVAHLRDLGLEAGEIAGLLAPIDIRPITSILRQLETGINAPMTSSCGRLFETVASLAAGLHRQSFEGQNAAYLESLVLRGCDEAYGFDLVDRGEILEVDYGPMLRALLVDVRAGEAPALMATRFHNGLVETVCRVSRRLRDRTGTEIVVLAGGVFANAYLLERAAAHLAKAGFKVVVNENVPLNDGGISLGQAAIVAAGGGEAVV